jgi:adenosylcobinamide-GDP ribazoletransferase
MADEGRTFESVIGALSGLGRDVLLAVRFLTRLPVPGKDKRKLSAAARAFPIAGALVGAVAGAALIGAYRAGLHPMASALAALAVAALLTGALHEDGLADTADGFGGGTRAQKLKIMRDSRIGVYGVLALVLGVGIRASILAGLLGPWAAAAALVAAGSLSRGFLPALMYLLPPARSGGLAKKAGKPTREGAVVAALLGAMVALIFLGQVAGLWAIAAAGVAVAAMAWLAQRQIGGQTGDVLGAAQQVAEMAVLAAAAAAG